jgi:hypothetical protein
VGVALPRVLDIADRADLGFETTAWGVGCPGAVITATLAVARTDPAVLFVPLPDQMLVIEEHDEGDVRVSCVSRAEGATSGAAPRSSPLTHPRKEGGGFALRDARQCLDSFRRLPSSAVSVAVGLG